jgi:endonuclease/exonuclease/phosphatase family metal-dependent hydrolase
MPEQLRIATFNVENLDDKPGLEPALDRRIAIMRPQLERLRADILCLQEVHGQGPSTNRQLSALRQLLQGTPYQAYRLAHTTTKSDPIPYKERNLVVLSRFPINQVENIRHSKNIAPYYRKITAVPKEEEAEVVEWERPILYLRIDLGNNRTLFLLNIHLKSKIPSDIKGQKQGNYIWLSVSAWAEGYFISSMKRVGQAIQLRREIDSIFDEAEQSGAKPFIAVCGDFNADHDSVPVNAIRGAVEDTGNPDLTPRVLVPCELSIPESSRYSLLHLGQGQMLDHVLVSRSLLAFYRGTEIHNEILPDESGAFRTDIKFPESDHAPVVADFVLP